jgi:hypothetical protein
MEKLAYLRSFRVGPVAAFDVVAAVAGAFIVAEAANVEKKKAVAAIVPATIVAHTIFKIDSFTTRHFFNADGDFFFKIGALFATYYAFN